MKKNILNEILYVLINLLLLLLIFFLSSRVNKSLNVIFAIVISSGISYYFYKLYLNCEKDDMKYNWIIHAFNTLIYGVTIFLNMALLNSINSKLIYLPIALFIISVGLTVIAKYKNTVMNMK